MYCQHFSVSSLKGNFDANTPKSVHKNHKKQISKKGTKELINNPERFTSASHVIVYSTEPLPWQLTVATAPSVKTKTSHTSRGCILRSKYFWKDILDI